MVGQAPAAGPVPATTPVGNVALRGQDATAAPSIPVQPIAKQAPVAAPDSGPRTGPVSNVPSILGLNTPTAGTSAGSRGDSGHDPLRPSSNLNYLLEDDEEEPRRGWGKLIFVVVALALVVGLGYLRWKQGGFDWLNASEKKPAAAQPTPDAAQGGADSTGAGGAATTTGGAVATPADSSAPQATAAPPTPSQATPSQGTPTQGTSSQSVDTQADVPQTVVPQTVVPQNGASDSTAPPEAAVQPAGSDSENKAPPAEPPAHPKAVPRKPEAAKPTAARPFDAVTEGERYIYGRGVRQDCDHGLRMLKPAAEQSNAKAMISLGALYSTGTCTPRDLPTAYRWFALALHKDPDNQALQDDLQKLWSQMTQPERQLAIKLSQ